MKWNVNRDSPEDRLLDYLDWMKAAKRDIEHQVCLRVGFQPGFYANISVYRSSCNFVVF